ncbi:zinc finger protein 131 isoform X5 [Motacilla alba alba]|uniref:zinc finger protein 131 isoform X5 n=1 Tax=Motacilla alba alba TaxID=1094192 RepID=UPI0018D5010D|nr:zinc finger protein 131 isoform X5 [Motacilla alba alba]
MHYNSRHAPSPRAPPSPRARPVAWKVSAGQAGNASRDWPARAPLSSVPGSRKRRRWSGKRRGEELLPTRPFVMEAEETMECIQEFPEHYKVILDRLNEQREQDQFTDITLIVDGHHFKAHKAVLAACSQFFHKFFQDFTQEPLVEIEGVSNMAFRHLIEFTYTAKLMVQGEEEANDVWKAAEYLQMLEAIKALEIRNKENSSPLESNEAQDITSKYRQGERKCQMQEEGDSATDPSCKQEHMKTHSTENYKCDICNKRYLRESALKQHLTCYHLDEGGASKKQRPGKKIHVCQYCDKQFDHFGHFKEHLRKHTGEKPFECPNCHERFARNSTLKCHLTACQSGAGAKKGRKKLYECQVCNSVFNSWDQFKDHLVIHTGDKPNHCTLCDLWFMQGSELRRHLKEMHNISELLVTEEVLPVEAMEAEPVTSMTIIEQVEQVHVLPVIQVQVDPAQVTVEQMHQDLIQDNQVKGTQMEELQEQVQISYLEVEHIQTEQGAEVHVEQLHVEHVNQIQMEEVQAELIDGTDLEQVEYRSVDQGEAEEKDHNQADDADKEHREQAEDLKTQLVDTQNEKVDE